MCVCMSVLMCPLLGLVGTTLSCLSAHVNAEPAQIKHDDVFLNIPVCMKCVRMCLCILCPYTALPVLRSLQQRHSYCKVEADSINKRCGL